MRLKNLSSPFANLRADLSLITKPSLGRGNGSIRNLSSLTLAPTPRAAKAERHPALAALISKTDDEPGPPTIRGLAGTYFALITCVPIYIPHPRSC
jgi:hypothetical protein